MAIHFLVAASAALHAPLRAVAPPIFTQTTRWPLRCTQIACTADPLAIADPALDGVPNQVEVSPLAGAAADPAIIAAAPDPPPFEEPGPVEDALAGLTVAFAVLSKAIACSAIVGVEPLVGVWSSVAVGAAAPAFGMRPGVMAGAAAVCAVPLGVFVSANGPELLPFVVLLAAAIEGVVGALRLTRYIDLVSPSVLAGFLNALGVLLFTSQLKVFAAAPDEYAAIGVAATSALIAQLLPRVTSVAVPAGLVGLTVASAAGPLLGLPLVSLASTTADAQAFAGGLASLPRPVDLPALASLVGGSADAFLLALPTAASVAFISLLETLLAAKLVDDLKCEELCVFFYDDDDVGVGEETCVDVVAGTTPALAAAPRSEVRDVPTDSVVALAVGNGISALLGGFGGCGLIPQTVLNLNSGGGGRLSSLAYAAAMATFVVALAPLVGQISQAALAGLMISVAFSTVQWAPTKAAIEAALAGDGDERAAVEARVNLAALLVAMVACYEVDFAAGIAIGVAVDVGLTALVARGEEAEAPSSG